MKFSLSTVFCAQLVRILPCTFCLLSISALSEALPQYINEFHYDNKGRDQFEYVEIAGVAGSDLSGWHIDFYNGSNGKIYASWSLSGVIDNEASGYGALSFSGSTGLQNGPNDGLALVNNLGSLVQFISYEGLLTGTEGAAAGVLSQDIGIVENGSVPIGHSLQLTGLGHDSAAFAWTSGVSSFGELNDGQGYHQAHPSKLPVHAVDEPSHLNLMSLALIGLCVGRRKIKR